MRRLVNRKKGATLAELCVVLAVITIISVVVVSFSVMVHQRVNISTDKLKAMEDITIVEHFIEGWVETMMQDRPDDTLNDIVFFATETVDDGLFSYKRLIAMRTTDAEGATWDNYKLFYRHEDDVEGTSETVLLNKLTAQTLDPDVTNAIVLETVTDISFAVKYYHEGSMIDGMAGGHTPTDWILFCTITYEVDMADDTDGTMTYTFCINPYVGNTVTVPEKETTQTLDTTAPEGGTDTEDTTVADSSADQGG